MNPTVFPLSNNGYVSGLINTTDLGFVVDEGLPLNTIYFNFHNSNEEDVAFRPAKKIYDFTRYCYCILNTTRSKSSSLNLYNIHNISTHITTYNLLVLMYLKTLQLVKIVKFINSLVVLVVVVV